MSRSLEEEEEEEEEEEGLFKADAVNEEDPEHQEKGSACWGSLFCMLTCKMTVLPLNMVASALSDAKLHVVTLYMLTCIRDVMHVNMHCCVCQHA